MQKIKQILLTDGKDLEGVERVIDIKYMKVIRGLLWWLASWPSRYIDDGVPETWKTFGGKCYVLMLEWGCLLPGMIYLKNRIGKTSFFELGHTYITVFMNIVASTRLVHIFQDSYQRLGGEFVNSFHLFHHKHTSEYAMQAHIKVHKMCHFFTYYIAILMGGGITLFNVTPLYNNLHADAFNNLPNSTLQHSVYYELPFDYKHELRGYFVIFTFNWYISFICSSCLCILDLYLSIMVFHVWGHLKLLIHNLEQFPHADKLDHNDMSTFYFSPEGQQKTYKKLRDILIHHRLITDFINHVNSVFGPSLFIFYTFHQVSGCLLLLECSQMEPDALVRYGPLTAIMFQQLIQISIVFELMGSMTDKLINAVYAVPWERMNSSNRKILMGLQIQSQVPIGLKAMGMVQVGVQTMVQIIRTSVSYFVMLRTVATEGG